MGKCNHPPCTSGLSGNKPNPNPTPSPSPHPHPHPSPSPPGPAPSGYACTDADAAAKWPFCDTTLSHEARLADLVKRVNVSEMGGQLTARESSALGRLGIPVRVDHALPGVLCAFLST